jgi:transglutaminase-like putative cysteine protease
VVDRLRADHVHDRAARPPNDCRDPLAHFLLHARRGPDYRFATAAAVLLRVLGYPTRLVSGFYVSPDHYDPVTRHTPVVQEDLHFWAEVKLPSGDWLVVEPTPGYEVLTPSQPWFERLGAALVALAWWGGALLLAFAAGWRWRRELIDTTALALWRQFPGRTWQQCVRRAVWLLECRGRWTGRPRRAAQTVPAWLRAALPADGAVEIEQLTRMAEWAAYATDLAPPWQWAETRNVCEQVLDAWTLRRWRRAVAP